MMTIDDDACNKACVEGSCSGGVQKESCYVLIKRKKKATKIQAHQQQLSLSRAHMCWNGGRAMGGGEEEPIRSQTYYITFLLHDACTIITSE